MADRDARPRARSEAVSPTGRSNPTTATAATAPTTTTRRTRAATGDWDYGSSPTRRVRSTDSRNTNPNTLDHNEGIRRRSTTGSSHPARRSSQRSMGSGRGIPSLTSRTTLAQRTQGLFTLAGPEGTPQLRLAHEPFVHPGYAELNPSYEQPANAKPVWSLAKPLPRVVRPGMVPTKEEVLMNRATAQMPAEQSQKEGLDVDPNELEEGRIGLSANPRKMAAQVQDARVQRENNFIDKILTGDTSLTRRTSTSSGRIRRRSTVGGGGGAAAVIPELPTVPETEQQQQKQHLDDTSGGSEGEGMSSEPLQPVPEDLHPLEEEEQQQQPQLPVDESETDKEDDTVDNIDFPEFTEAAYPEDLHPLVQDLVEDEVHNNHTTWSVIRTHHREALAESLGVFVQLTIGFCADLSVTLAAAGNPNTTSWAWGLATMMAIYISGGVSGAHLNPVITLMFWFYRGFPKRKIPEYFAAQFSAAFIAAFVSYGVYYVSIHEYLTSSSSAATASLNIINSFVTSRRETWITPATAFFTEFLGTAVLAITVLALGDDQNAPPGAGMNALIIGLSIFCIDLGFAAQTGAALNPSRDFAPRLALLALGYGRELFTDPYWFYGPWAGALTGAFVGAFLYDFMIFTGGESPVNYPLERTQRAMRKSRMKWRRRLHLKEKGTAF